MKVRFTLESLKFTSIEELPDAWTSEDFSKLLDNMDYGDTAGMTSAELKEMCWLSLADQEPSDAAEILLNYLFAETLNKGQIENLSHEMIDEKMWEEYADLSTHEKFFNAHQLLYQAFNGTFPKTNAVKFSVKISANPKDLERLESNTEAQLISLLVQGMPENTLINRLFTDQIGSDDFKEAKDIIWQYKKGNIENDGVVYDIISSSYWFHDFKYVETFEAGSTVDTHLIK